MTFSGKGEFRRGLAVAALLASSVLVGKAVVAQEITDDVTIFVGYGPGAAYDLTARTIAAHLGQYIPGEPNVVVENAPGAGGLRLLREYLATGATDGSELVTISQTPLTLNAILDPDGTDFDPTMFRWIGGFSIGAAYCIATVESGVTSLDELIAAEEFIMGSPGPTSPYLLGLMINNVFGGNISFVTGFSGAAELNLAMARGEVDGTCGYSYSSLPRHAEVFDFVPIIELAPEPSGLIEGVDFLLDRITDPLSRAATLLMFQKDLFGFPIIAHPDTPDDIVELLRTGFIALADDDAFIQEATDRQLETIFTDGATIQALVDDIFGAPEDVKERLRELVTAPE